MSDNNLPFLKQLSHEVMEKHGRDMHSVALVFPNRRAGLFFRKYLAEKISKPIFTPQIFSIEDLIINISKRSLGGSHQLLLMLYKVYRDLEVDKARDFDDFLNWAPVLLDDFNEIDLYLANPTQVFSYLSEARAISQWSPEAKPLTEFQQSYLHFYQSLEKYYQGFQQSMITHGLSSQGSAYRYVAEHIAELLPEFQWDTVVFAGFNALTLAEEKIILHLLGAGKAEIYWDCDTYYLNNPIQEAGKFLRKYKERHEFGPLKWINNHYQSDKKSIHILGIPQHIGQAKVAGQLLAGIPEEALPETALILSDENMLIPVLNSVPDKIRDFNVTMGLPLRLTPVDGLFDALFRMHLKTSNLNRGKQNEIRSYYYKDLLSVFRHPWFSELLDANHVNAGYDNPEKGTGLKERAAILLNKSFFSYGEVIQQVIKPGILDPYPLDFLFEDYAANPLQLIRSFQKLLHHLKEHYKNILPEGNSVEMEYLYAYSVLFSQILEIWESEEIPVTLSSVYKLYRQSAQSVKLPFYGEPLKGMQLMGMLETRNLDFKNIILLHVNDDILPAGKNYNSFIPLDIKEHFKLPTYRDRQAVFAYHFYRLLQRAESVYLLYNTESGPVAGGEKSRFIHQLQQELPLYNPSVNITEEIIAFPPLDEKLINPIIITKDKVILEKIRQKNEKGWSASTLNQYRKCKLMFYYSQVAGIEEPEEAEESMDSKALGTAFHETLEKLFKPHTGELLTPEIYEHMLSKLPDIIPEVFRKNIQSGDIEYGKNFLLLQVAESVITKFLKKEKEGILAAKADQGNYTLLALEKYMSAEINGYKLIGIADRIDKRGGVYRILDYKSGSISDNELSFSDFNKLENGSNTDKVFQLLFYSLLFFHSQQYPPHSIIPCLVSMRRPEKAHLNLKLPSGVNLIPHGLDLFKELVVKILDEIHHPDIPFDQTDNPDICKYCPYKAICIR